MTVCQRCPAGIRFVTMTATGRAMPVDPFPDDHGNIAATPAGAGQYVNGRYLAAGEPLRGGEVRLMPHWSTCADPTITGRPQRRARPEQQPTLLDT